MVQQADQGTWLGAGQCRFRHLVASQTLHVGRSCCCNLQGQQCAMRISHNLPLLQRPQQLSLQETRHARGQAHGPCVMSCHVRISQASCKAAAPKAQKQAAGHACRPGPTAWSCQGGRAPVHPGQAGAWGPHEVLPAGWHSPHLHTRTSCAQLCGWAAAPALAHLMLQCCCDQVQKQAQVCSCMSNSSAQHAARIELPRAVSS